MELVLVEWWGGVGDVGVWLMVGFMCCMGVGIRLGMGKG